MNMKQVTLITTSLLGIAANPDVFAGQTANYYKCSGNKIQLTLSIGSEAEAGIYPVNTALTLIRGEKAHTFSKPDLTKESTVIGDLWEVVLSNIQGKYIDHATVVIPSVVVDEMPVDINGRPVPVKFKTKLILTREYTPLHKSSFVGAVNPSTYTDISCKAEVLYW